MKITVRIAVAFLISLLVFVTMGVLFRRTVERVGVALGWVEHTYAVISSLEILKTDIRAQESDVRGYVISGDPVFLKRYEATQFHVARVINRLNELTRGNSVQAESLTQLRPLVAQRIDHSEQLINVRRERGLAQAQQLVSSKSGFELTENIRTIIEKMQQEEQTLLATRSKEMLDSIKQSEHIATVGTLTAIALKACILFWLIFSINKAIGKLAVGTKEIAEGNLDHRIELKGRDELTFLAQAFNNMAERLKVLRQLQADQDWLKTNLNHFAKVLQGQNRFDTAAKIIVDELAPMLAVQGAAIYLFDKEISSGELMLSASYGCGDGSNLPAKIKVGQGLVGQCAEQHQPIFVEEVPNDAIVIRSAFSSGKPGSLVIQPILHDGQLKAVMELVSYQKLSSKETEFLKKLSSWLGAVFTSIESAVSIERLLAESQTANEELQVQQEELEAQQDELRKLNDELEQRADALDSQNQAILEKNRQLEGLRNDLETKAKELTLASKYKSDFLANVSHDLRTPLNSLLIFSEILAENEEQNLTVEQVDFAQSIYDAGKSLLALVDDVLDLSKIESGTLGAHISSVSINSIILDLKRTYGQTAERKGLKLSFDVEDGVPEEINTDEKRLSQILKNLMTNAVKFTSEGSVSLSVGTALKAGYDYLKFTVADTGIGIAKEKQSLVFESFQQADSDTRHKYGGTGLGLAISRELARLLHGSIELQSEPNKGSIFTLFIPLDFDLASKQNASLASVVAAIGNGNEDDFSSGQFKPGEEFNLIKPDPEIDDDRYDIAAGDAFVLIIEHDAAFAQAAVDLSREQGFKALIARGGFSGVSLARRLKPTAIILNLKLPDANGWVIFDQLKYAPETRTISVHMVSPEEDTVDGAADKTGIVTFSSSERLLHEMALFLHNVMTLGESHSVSEPVLGDAALMDHTVLLVDDDERNLSALSGLFKKYRMNLICAESGEQALDILSKSPEIELVLMDMMMPGLDGYETIKEIRQRKSFQHLPVISVTAKAMKDDRHKCLEVGANDYITKPVDKAQLLSLLRVWLYKNNNHDS